MNTRSKLRRTAVIAAAGATTLAVALPAFTGASAAKTRHSASKTVTLPARHTKTIDVRYPQALKFKNARYSCAFKVTGLGRRHVKILSHGSALGGTVCRVKARNNAKLPSIDTTAKIKVTATTVY